MSVFSGFFLALLSVVPLPLQAEEGKKAPAAKSLLQANALGNWASCEYGGEGEIAVHDGVLTLGRGEPLTGVKWTGEPLPKANYELTLQARRVDGNDFFAAITFPVQNDYCTLVLGGWGGGLIGLSSIDGSDASENETTGYFSFEKGRWYNIRIRVTDKMIQAWIDDQAVANVDYSQRKISVRIEMELCKPMGLASFATIGAIRNIAIRELPIPQGQQ
jgi:hypothetical protein